MLGRRKALTKSPVTQQQSIFDSNVKSLQQVQNREVQICGGLETAASGRRGLQLGAHRLGSRRRPPKNEDLNLGCCM